MKRSVKQSSKTRSIALQVAAAIVVASVPVANVWADAAPAKPAQQGDLVVEVKQWMRVQWHTLKTYWNGSAPAAVAQAPALQKQVLPVAKSAGGSAGNGNGTAAPVQQKSMASTASVQAPAPQAQASTSAPSKIAGPTSAASAPTLTAPNAMASRKLVAPPTAKAVPEIFEDKVYVEQAGMKKTDHGVPVYDLKTSTKIPRLSIGSEERIKPATYKLDTRMQKIVDDRVITPFDSPELLSQADLKRMMTIADKPQAAHETKDVVFLPKGRVSRAAFDKIVMNLAPEAKINLGKFKYLTSEEVRFLSGLLLYQKGDKCAAAVGLFHTLSMSPAWQSEANYYLAMCSKKLGLQTDFYERSRRVFDGMDNYYATKLIKEIGYEVPYEFTDGVGTALAKIVAGGKFFEKLDAKQKADVAYILTDYGASTDRFKLAINWAKQVPTTHAKYLNAQFLLALSEYQAGSKDEAFRIQDKLIADLKTDKTKAEFQALVALNLGRMAFQEQNFKKARESFAMVYKDHPLWLQSLTEMGWAQLMANDYEGAIGNMYSIQSPFFRNVYKPESYVIRTVGYLDLCQYGDAYKTLSMLEHDYRPELEQIEKFIGNSGKKEYYTVIKDFLHAPKEAKEVDGLPMQIVREMARHRDFTNLQKALNRQIDERPQYTAIESEIDRSLKHAQTDVSASRKRADLLRRRFASAKTKPELAQRNVFAQELNKELDQLNDLFFEVDLYNEAKTAMTAYRKDVIAGADKRLETLKGKTEQVLANRLLKMRVDLTRTLDNNELLRYEVFAGSGENIRYQVAGGDTAKRVPANVIPKSKALHWDFDGEYWEDEIGNYRSTLKNNCPNANVRQAAGEGVEE